MPVSSTRDLYAAYTAMCDRVGSEPLKLGSFKNKAAIIAATNELDPGDDTPAAASLSPTVTGDSVVIGVSLSKVQRATLRREFEKRGLTRPDGWRNASIPTDLASRIGII